MVGLTNGDSEHDICAIHGGLARFCSECGMMTVWRHISEAVGARRTAVTVKVAERCEPAKGGEELVPLAEAIERVNRRSKVRAKVNFHACVRSHGFGEEVVKCIDMSRGGVSFRSRNEYRRGMTVEIAVPFAPEEKRTPAIFVRSRIANVIETAGGMYRCGMEFLK